MFRPHFPGALLSSSQPPPIHDIDKTAGKSRNILRNLGKYLPHLLRSRSAPVEMFLRSENFTTFLRLSAPRRILSPFKVQHGMGRIPSTHDDVQSGLACTAPASLSGSGAHSTPGNNGGSLRNKNRICTFKSLLFVQNSPKLLAPRRPTSHINKNTFEANREMTESDESRSEGDWQRRQRELVGKCVMVAVTFDNVRGRQRGSNGFRDE